MTAWGAIQTTILWACRMGMLQEAVQGCSTIFSYIKTSVNILR